jgi:RNA polymerase sigma factor (sigma-70 family)
MANSQQLPLRQYLLAGYAEMRRRLARRLGSDDLASEVLHETYLRLDRQNAAAPSHPIAYIFRTALNIASDRRRAEYRRLAYSEVELLYHFADGSTDGEQEAEVRSELAALARAFETLTPRQRAIVIAVRVDGTPHAELAERFGISLRMVDKELRKALEHCAKELERTLVTRFGSHPFKASDD